MTRSEPRPPSPSSTPPSPEDAAAFAAAHGDRVELGVPSLVWGPGQERRLRMVEAVTPLAGRRVLDVGCGVGQYVRRLRELTAQAVGVDVERARVVEGGRSVPGLLVADGAHLPFPDASFDVVLLNEVIEHMPDARAGFAECARVTAAGGHVVIFAPNRWFPFETHGVQWRGRYRFGNYPLVNWLPRRWRDRLVPHADVYTRADLRRLYAGLPVRPVVSRTIYPGFDGMRARHARLGRLLQATLHRAESTPLQAFGLSHFVVLERVGEAGP